MSEAVLDRARDGDGRAFSELISPYLAELRLHCYRILGSVADAEDMLQETLLAAWQGLAGYEGRASVRSWLYRIATNRCLNALRDASRRPRPQPPVPPFALPTPTRVGEPVWLEPYPDSLLDGIPDGGAGPDARYEAKEAVTLAFAAAIQHLPPRQRAVLLLRDVLGFRSAEVASIMNASAVSVNSALQRARATLAAQLPGPERERAPLPHSARERDLAARFAAAYTGDDVDGMVALLTDDAWYTMPPLTMDYQGREAIGSFLRASIRWRGTRKHLLVPARANGQPAYGSYVLGSSSPVFEPHGLIVLTLEGDQISAVTRFVDSAILGRFGLPRALPR